MWHFMIDPGDHYYSRADRSEALAHLADQLSRSEGGDLYLALDMRPNEPEDSNRRAELHFFVAAIHLLKRYSNQLAYIVLFWRHPSITPWLFELADVFQNFPRLHTLKIIRDRRLLSLQQANGELPPSDRQWFDDLVSLYTSASMLELERNSQSSSLLQTFIYWNSIANDFHAIPPIRIPTGPILETLKLWNWSTMENPCSWEQFIQILDGCPRLTCLSADLRHVNIPENRTSPMLSINSPLRRIKIAGPVSAHVALWTRCHYPSLIKLAVYLIPSSSVERKGATEDTMSLISHRFPSLRNFKYFSYSESESGNELLQSAQNAGSINRIHLCGQLYWRLLGYPPSAEDNLINPFPLPCISPKELCVEVPSSNERRPRSLNISLFTRFSVSKTETLEVRELKAEQWRIMIFDATESKGSIFAPRLSSINIFTWDGGSNGLSFFNAFLDFLGRFEAPMLQRVSLTAGWGRQREKSEAPGVTLSFNRLSTHPSLLEVQSMQITWQGRVMRFFPENFDHKLLSNVRIVKVTIAVDPTGRVLDVPSDYLVSYLRYLGEQVETDNGQPVIQRLPFLQEFHIKTIRQLKEEEIDTFAGIIERIRAGVVSMIAARKDSGCPLKSVTFCYDEGKSLLSDLPL
jgi:hypothetical protein